MQANACAFRGVEFRDPGLILVMVCIGSPAIKWMSDFPPALFSRKLHESAMTNRDQIDKSFALAFRNAPLLCANMGDAEASLIDAIETVGNVAEAGFHQQVIRAAIGRSDNSISNPRERITFCRVLLLPKRLRHCFVLRVLLGFAAEESADLLGLASCDIDEVLRMSIQLLPLTELNREAGLLWPAAEK
jgi:hypothetical protein